MRSRPPLREMADQMNKDTKTPRTFLPCLQSLAAPAGSYPTSPLLQQTGKKLRADHSDWRAALSRKLKFYLEQKLQRELDLARGARITRLESSGRDNAEVEATRDYSQARVSEIGLVEDIKEIRPEYEA